MPRRVDRRTDPLSATAGGDRGQVLTGCRTHLLKLIQNVGSRLLEKRPPLFSHLDGVRKLNCSRDVWHFTDYVQWRFFTAHGLKVQPQGFRERELRYSQVILGSNKQRKLIVIRYLCLEHVEPRNCSRFKTILLVL